MKYFTKYLPVEGEVQKHDRYYFKDNPDNILIRTGDKTSPSLQKVKLFLCSRDIQVGDKVYPYKYYFEAGSIVKAFKEGSKSVFYFEGKEPILKNFHSTENWGKVIGEISPEAKFVKEGDEFDEEQIQITTPFNYKEGVWKDIYRQGKDRITGDIKPVRPYSPSFGISRWEILNPQVEDILVKIKCSQCKSFH